MLHKQLEKSPISFDGYGVAGAEIVVAKNKSHLCSHRAICWPIPCSGLMTQGCDKVGARVCHRSKPCQKLLRVTPAVRCRVCPRPANDTDRWLTFWSMRRAGCYSGRGFTRRGLMVVRGLGPFACWIAFWRSLFSCGSLVVP